MRLTNTWTESLRKLLSVRFKERINMGDYNKLIVSCTVKVENEKELNDKIEELGLGSSAYQSQERIVSIIPNDWHHRKGCLNLILVGQTKYGRGQDEFCKWLKPYVVQGSGENEVYAISFSEYSDTPTMWKLQESEEN